MRQVLIAALLLVLPQSALADGPYRILKIVTVGGEGGFDYMSPTRPAAASISRAAARPIRACWLSISTA